MLELLQISYKCNLSRDLIQFRVSRLLQVATRYRWVLGAKKDDMIDFKNATSLEVVTWSLFCRREDTMIIYFFGPLSLPKFDDPLQK